LVSFLQGPGVLPAYCMARVGPQRHAAAQVRHLLWVGEQPEMEQQWQQVVWQLLQEGQQQWQQVAWRLLLVG
jgi:hypothetical protein